MEREQERELRRQREDLANGRVKSIPLLRCVTLPKGFLRT